MNASIITAVINGAFSTIAMMRRQGMTNAEINARLDRVDNYQEAIKAEEVQASLDSWQVALDEADALIEKDEAEGAL